MPTYTTTYSLGKPVVGADEDAWGDTLNTSLDAIDDILDGTTPITGIDINSGTLDGVTIGGTTAGAGTFTTLTANTSITGTLATAAQTNITSVGTLTSLDVGGTVTADGLTVDGKVEVNGVGSTTGIQLDNGSQAHNWYLVDNFTNRWDIGTSSLGAVYNFGSNSGARTHLQITTGGDISFYEDTGTTAKFFWDASTERLGIGNSSPATALDVTGTVTADGLTVNKNINSTSIPTSRSDYQVSVEVDGAHTGDYVGGIAFGDQALSTAQAAILVADRGASGATGLSIATGNTSAITQRIRVDDIGDISFYEDTGTTAKFFWDASAEALGIGTSSPSYPLTVAGKISYNGAIGEGADNTLSSSSTTLILGESATWQNLSLRTNGSERMRIDSSGKLLVSTSTAYGDNGTTILEGEIYSRKTSSRSLTLDRRTTDGEIVQFRKDGTTVGSIGTAAAGTTAEFGIVSATGQLVLGTTTNNNHLQYDNTALYPVPDNTVNLGYSTLRWKDLYLSGGVYLGGTGAANKLDDFEEGQFDVTISPATSGTISISTAYDKMRYTKVGNIVHIQGEIRVAAVSSPVGADVRINNLPFAALNGTDFAGRVGGATYYYQASSTSIQVKAFRVVEQESRIRFAVDASTVTAGDEFGFSFTYTVA
jgi:hypothetical protein